MCGIKQWRGFLAIIYLLFVVSLPAFAEPPDSSPIPDARVARAVFTSGIEAREPIDRMVVLENTATSIYFFTDLRHLQGRRVTHRWEYDGQVISEIPFDVGGPRWRVFSQKTLNPNMLGKWTVVVVDQSGWPLHASIFEYKHAE